MLQGKRILLIITGSIAAYKSLDLIRLLTKAGASVEGVLTKGGAQFVTPLSVETLTGKKAHIEMWDESSYEMNHIELSRRADLIIIAPATADFISKMIHGKGDDLASTIILAKNKPIILAPSMNVEMWDNPAFQRNLTAAQTDGAQLVLPQIDTLACGEVGIGKMAEPATIIEAVEAHFALASSLERTSAIVTSGATIERIDSVRFLSNFSSGKQGAAIALALANAGAQVTLVSGKSSEATPLHPRITTLRIESAAEMLDAVHQGLPADIFVGCAAVCDFAIANRAERKIKKSEGLRLEFEESPDIVRSIGMLPSPERPQIVVGFAAETDRLIDYARKKLSDKGCDLIVANDVSEGAVFGKDENQASFVTQDSVDTLETMSKKALGRAIASWVAQALQAVKA
jgi:phosphopantothenoylcysteine decarboxylase/phosphopantothenate--cysteine ligase